MIKAPGHQHNDAFSLLQCDVIVLVVCGKSVKYDAPKKLLMIFANLD